MKTNIIITLIAVLCTIGTAQAQSKKTDTLNIKSSVVCGMCKDRIEQGLAFVTGIKDVTVNVETKEVQIIYNSKKRSAADLRKSISDLGYDADDINANLAAYDKLPACCKKDNATH